MKTCLLSTITGKKQLPFFKGFVITAFLVLFSSISVWATHYRYGNIQWTDNGGNKVTFKIQQAWRWSYFGDPAIGSIVEIAAADGDVLFDFGDGQSVAIQIKVTSINASEDWFFGEVTYVHTYASSGNYTASFEGCCRISTLQNNHDENFRLHTLVNVGNGAHSTVSTVVPIVDLPVNNASASFTIPVVDPDGHTVSFRLATAAEAAGTGNPYVQPAGLSVNTSSGLVTFSTVGKTVGDLYTSQVIINNGVTEIAVDFIIRIVPNPPPSTPPYFVYPPTPPDGTTFNVNVGSPLSFDVKAQDDDPGSSVTLTVVGMPAGATTTPALPTNGQPVSAQFNWTPTISNVGSYILVFTATDNTGISVTTQVNIKVSAVCDPDFSSSITVSPSPTIPGGDINTIYVGNGPQSVTLAASASGGNGSNAFDWSTGETGASIIVSPTETTIYDVTVTDAGGCTTKSSVTIYVVDSPPIVLDCPGDTTLDVCQTQEQIDEAFQAWLNKVSASGGCNGSLTNDNTGAPKACVGGTVTVNFTYTSTCGQAETTCSSSFTVIKDDIKPTFTSCPAGGDLGCNPSTIPGAATATATDNCGTPTITSEIGDVIVDGCGRSRTTTYTATDACGNTATCTQLYTWKVDVTKPEFTYIPAGGDLGCNPSTIPDAGTATATDNCGTPTITAEIGSVIIIDCSSRSRTTTYTATDDCGNTATGTQVYTWKVDVTKPEFTYIPAGGDLGCNPSTIPGVGTATATDNCGTPNITSQIGSVITSGCSRSRTTTYTATDGCGNTATATQIYTWKVDVTKPVFTYIPAGGDLGCNPSTIPGAGTAIATDNCGTPNITSQIGSVITSGCSRSRTTTYTATDGCGNKATCTQTYTWKVDVTKPVFTGCPATIKVGACHNVVTYTIKATDNGGTATVVCVPASGSTFNVGTTKVTCTATDQCGNKAVQTFNVVVVAPPTCSLKMPTKPRGGCGGNKLCATTSAGIKTYSWTLSGTGWKITAGQNTSCVTYTTGKAGSSATFTLKVTDCYGCTSTCTITVGCQASSAVATVLPSDKTDGKPALKAYPNPFSTTINFQFTAPVKGKATLETYDLLGHKLAVVFDGNVDAGAINNVTYNVPAQNRGATILYVLTIGSNKLHGLMLPTR